MEDITDTLVLTLAGIVFEGVATLLTTEKLAPSTPPVLLLALITLEELVARRLPGAGDGVQQGVPALYRCIFSTKAIN